MPAYMVHMSRYLVFGKPPTKQELYSDWKCRDGSLKSILVMWDDEPMNTLPSNLTSTLTPVDLYANDIYANKSYDIFDQSGDKTLGIDNDPADKQALAVPVLLPPPSQLARTGQITNELTLISDMSDADDDTSNVNLPNFRFQASYITQLIEVQARVAEYRGLGQLHGQPRVNLLVHIIERRPLQYVKTRQSNDTPLLNLVVGDETGTSLRISAWELQAIQLNRALTQGDVIHLSGSHLNF